MDIFVILSIAAFLPNLNNQKLPRLEKEKREALKNQLRLYFDDVQILNETYIEIIKDQDVIRVEMRLRHKSNQHYTIIYLKITKTLEPELQKLLRIHFYCNQIDGDDWIYEVISPFFASYNLTQDTAKAIHNLISKRDRYLQRKRKLN